MAKTGDTATSYTMSRKVQGSVYILHILRGLP
jgi:hypothetical protein